MVSEVLNPFPINNLRKYYTKPKKVMGFGYEDGKSKPVFAGEVQAVIKLETADTNHFIKTFMEFYSILKDLSSPAVKVLCYIGEHLVGNKDVIELPYDKVAKYCGYKTKKAFYQGINELVEKGVIEKKKAGLYWINANIFFKGDRRTIKTKKDGE